MLLPGFVDLPSNDLITWEYNFSSMWIVHTENCTGWLKRFSSNFPIPPLQPRFFNINKVCISNYQNSIEFILSNVVQYFKSKINIE